MKAIEIIITVRAGMTHVNISTLHLSLCSTHEDSLHFVVYNISYCVLPIPKTLPISEDSTASTLNLQQSVF